MLRIAIYLLLTSHWQPEIDGQLSGEHFITASTRSGLFAGAHDGRLCGGPVQRQLEAVRELRQRIQSFLRLRTRCRVGMHSQHLSKGLSL